MKHEKEREVFDNQALAPLTRKLFDGSSVPNEIRWTHEERETMLEGKTGYGKIGFGEPKWSRATSKPDRRVFGKAKPQKVGCLMVGGDMKLEQDPPSKPVRIHEIRPIVTVPQGHIPQVLVCVAEGKFDKDEHAVKVAEKIRQLSLRMDRHVSGKVLKKAKPSMEGVVVKGRRYQGYTPGIVGMDKARVAESDPKKEIRAREDRNNLILYWLTLRSIYRLIYG